MSNSLTEEKIGQHISITTLLPLYFSLMKQFSLNKQNNFQMSHSKSIKIITNATE
jgi:hypothetical protein